VFSRIETASLAALISVAFGQTFEVASVKPADPTVPGRRFQGGPGTARPNYRYRGHAARSYSRSIRGGFRSDSNSWLDLGGAIRNSRAQLGTITGQNTYAPGRIVDKTGLTGKYDFRLEYAGGGGIGALLSPSSSDASEPTGGPSLIEAMEKQLGLKLTKTTGHLDVLVIDHAEKTPTEK